MNILSDGANGVRGSRLQPFGLAYGRHLMAGKPNQNNSLAKINMIIDDAHEIELDYFRFY